MKWGNADGIGQTIGRVYGKAASVLAAGIRRLGIGVLAGCIAAASQGTFAADEGGESYGLGQGYQLPGAGLTLGGYSTLSFEKLRGATPRTSLDDASLFIWWEGDGRWKFFSELDFENALSTRKAAADEGPYLALERLYFDYAWSETATVRLGKFLTPIGRWNLIHATPLVWTTSRPLVTKHLFPTNATGIMLNGTLPEVGGGLEYSLYHSNGHEIRANPAMDPFYEATGFRLVHPLFGGGQVGLSYAAFEQNSAQEDKKRLLGLDYHWSRNRYEFSVEAAVRSSGNGSSWEEKGVFVQGVAPLSEKLYAVGRYEHYRQALQPAPLRQWLIGINYRMTPALVFKAEWIGSRDNRIGAPDGFMSSFSILF